jgi:antirestriction protein
MINVFITNLGKYNEGYLIGEWIALPADKEDVQALFDRIGINEEYEEYFITDYETDLPMEIGEYENVFSLNDMAEELSELTDYELKKYKAILEAGFWREHKDIIDHLDDYNLSEDITNCTEYAEMLIDDNPNIPEDIKGYINYEAYGNDMSSCVDGAFTEYGWIERI